MDTGFAQGDEVTPFYDPLLAKVIAHGPSREVAIEQLLQGLSSFEIAGVKCNIPALCRILASKPFARHELHTGLTEEVMARASA